MFEALAHARSAADGLFALASQSGHNKLRRSGSLAGMMGRVPLKPSGFALWGTQAD